MANMSLAFLRPEHEVDEESREAFSKGQQNKELKVLWLIEYMYVYRKIFIINVLLICVE